MTGQQDNFPNFPDFEEDGSKKYELIKDMLGWFNERKDITGPEFLERYSSRIPHKIYKNLSINNFSISLPESDEGSSQMRESQVS